MNVFFSHIGKIFSPVWLYRFTMNVIKKLSQVTLISFFMLPVLGFAAEIPSKASNSDSIVNTRHNMTQSYLGGTAGWMSLSRNNYEEVCVYCHTPHGTNTRLDAPLWNRTHKSNTYTTYDTLKTSTLTQTVTQPGLNSLTCLSCHDGTIAIDSIINMPGSGRLNNTQASGMDIGFLDAWSPGPGDSFWGGHGTLDPAKADTDYGACMACHGSAGWQYDPSTTPVFDVFYIGLKLTDDHPIGITYPVNRTPAVAGANSDFFATDGDVNTVPGRMTFYDTNINGRADSNEIRFYDTGDGPEVECASCHDPHGVSQTYPARGLMNPTFLRIKNDGSALCLTCHDK